MTLVASKRKNWVDMLRAFAQLLVIIDHLKIDASFSVVATAVKIPLFFAISGYVFRSKGEKEFYVNLLTRLVLPWIALTMVRFVAGSFVKGPGYLVDGFRDILMGRVAWYMPCAIVAQILHHYLRKLCSNGFLLAGCCCLCFGVGMVLTERDLLNVLMVNRALVMQLYLLLGYLFTRLETKVPHPGWKLPLLLFGSFLTLCGLAFLLFENRAFDIHNNAYFHLPLNLLMIFTGCLSLMALAKQIGKAPRFLCFIGQNTIIFYIWEAYPRTIFKKGLSILGLSLPGGIPEKLILLAVTIAGCSVAALVMNRFLPELVGKKRKRA